MTHRAQLLLLALLIVLLALAILFPRPASSDAPVVASRIPASEFEAIRSADPLASGQASISADPQLRTLLLEAPRQGDAALGRAGAAVAAGPCVQPIAADDAPLAVQAILGSVLGLGRGLVCGPSGGVGLLRGRGLVGVVPAPAAGCSTCIRARSRGSRRCPVELWRYPSDGERGRM